MPASKHDRARSVLTGALLTLLPSAGAAQQAVSEVPGGAPFEVVEASIQELQQAMTSGQLSAVQLVDAYLARIAAYDQQGPRLNAMIRLNPRAKAEAEAKAQAEARAAAEAQAAAEARAAAEVAPEEAPAESNSSEAS